MEWNCAELEKRMSEIRYVPEEIWRKVTLEQLLDEQETEKEILEPYMAELMKLAPLSLEHVLACREAIRSRGSENAREEICRVVESCLLMVAYLAREYKGLGISVVELMQVGNETLMCTVEKNAWEGEFLPYVFETVRIRLYEYVRQERTQEMKHCMEERMRKAREQEKMEEDKKSAEELAAMYRAERERLIREKWNAKTCELFIETQLTERERKLFSYRVEEQGGHSAQEAAEYFHLTSARVRQIEARIIRKVYRFLKALDS